MRAKALLTVMISVIIMLFPGFVGADLSGIPAVTLANNGNGSATYSVSLQILVLMTALTLLPGMLLCMTSFTRVVVVLAILRQAIGMPQTPTNQILIGLSLFLSFFIMAPVFEQVNTTALQPYLEEKIESKVALDNAIVPIKKFMLAQTRKNDLQLFLHLAKKEASANKLDTPLTVLMPAFVTSELKTAFQMGFMLFLPFLIIDLVVSTVLMALGMMMLSPMIISLPFKIMLFVLVDGWALVMGSLAASFGI